MIRRHTKQDQEAPETSLPSGPPCRRCDGARAGDHVNGGWLIRYKRQGTIWYNYAEACPDCAFGFYRNKMGAPFYHQFPDLSAREIAHLWPYLKTGTTLRQAVEALPFPDLRARMLTHVEDLEARERGWTPRPDDDADGWGSPGPTQYPASIPMLPQSVSTAAAW